MLSSVRSIDTGALGESRHSRLDAALSPPRGGDGAFIRVTVPYSADMEPARRRTHPRAAPDRARGRRAVRRRRVADAGRWPAPRGATARGCAWRRARADAVEIEGGAARGVRRADGSFLDARAVVLAVSPSAGAALVPGAPDQQRTPRGPARPCGLPRSGPLAAAAAGRDLRPRRRCPLYLSVHSSSARLAPAGYARPPREVPGRRGQRRRSRGRELDA